MGFRISNAHIVLSLVFVFSLLSSCLSIKNGKQVSDPKVHPIILIKDGCGKNNNGEILFHNSIPCIAAGLQQGDGIEIGIQMSTDKELFLFHRFDSIPSSRLIPDVYLSASSLLEAVNDTAKYASPSLHKVLSYHRRHNLDKPILLEVNVPKGCFWKMKNAEKYCKNVALVICNLAKQYELEEIIMVESDEISILEQIKIEVPTVKCFYSTKGKATKDLRKALKLKIDGISVDFQNSKITAIDVSIIHYNSLKVLLKTINSQEDFKTSLRLNPDYIITEEYENFPQIEH